MRRVLISCLMGLWLVGCTCALAHNEAEELGHHWEIKSYVGELHFQLAAMICTAFLIAAGTFVIGRWRNRSANR